MTYNILDFIPYGHDNAISMQELAIRADVDARTARKAVYLARINGAVICSTCEGEGKTGYFRPLTPDEAVPYVRMQKSRIRSAMKAVQSAVKFIESEEGAD